jgi:hypothetical protein
VTAAVTVERSAWQRKASPPRRRDRTPDDQTPVVPRMCQAAMAPCETRCTAGLGFTHKRS